MKSEKTWLSSKASHRLITVATLAFLPLLIRDPYLQHVLVNSLIFLLVLLGLNIITGLSGQVSLCQAALYGVGAYTSAILAKQFHVPFWLSLPTAAFAAGLLGLGLSALTVKMRSHYLALATIGFGEILVNVFRSADRWTGGANGLSAIPPPTIYGWAISGPFSYYYLALLLAALGYGAMTLIGRSQLGNSFLAVRENEVAAASLGLDSVRLKISAFALGSAYAGAAGALYAHFDGFIGPESFSTGHSILLFCVLVVGGLGRPLGAVLAVGLFVLGQEFFRAFSQYQLLLFGATVVGIMILAPQGSAGLLSALWKKVRPNRDESRSGEAPEWHLNVSKGSEVATVNQPHSPRTEETPVKSGSQDFASLVQQVVIEKISLRFGGVTALNNVSFDIRTGEILCLIGPNGAGKTTLINVLGGQLSPESGSVLIRKRPSKNSVLEESLQLVGCRPHKIARLGLSRTFQTSQLFSELSVFDNVLTGRYIDPVTQPSVLVTLLQPWRALKKDAAARRAAGSTLRSTGLFEDSHRLAKHLPYGLRRILEISRALAMEPQILLLDEPSAGMNQSERKKLGWLLHEVRRSGVTLLIVAHDLELVRNLADRVVVLDHGEVIYCGPPEELRQNQQVVSAYLGNHEGAYATRR